MSGRVVAGMALIAVGVLFLLGEAGVVDRPGAVLGDWWPVVFVAIGVGLAVEQRRLAAGPLIFLALGLLLLAGTTDLVALTPQIVWPLLALAVGGWLLLRPTQAASKDPHLAGASVDLTAVFGDRRGRSVDAFERATLTALFGDVDLDLRDAEPGEDMTVDVTVVFGDVDVTVPAHWRVEMATSSLFADVEHRAAAQAAARDAPLLRVRGFSVFGDVTVRQ